MGRHAKNYRRPRGFPLGLRVAGRPRDHVLPVRRERDRALVHVVGQVPNCHQRPVFLAELPEVPDLQSTINSSGGEVVVKHSDPGDRVQVGCLPADFVGLPHHPLLVKQLDGPVAAPGHHHLGIQGSGDAHGVIRPCLPGSPRAHVPLVQAGEHLLAAQVLVDAGDLPVDVPEPDTPINRRSPPSIGIYVVKSPVGKHLRVPPGVLEVANVGVTLDGGSDPGIYPIPVQLAGHGVCHRNQQDSPGLIEIEGLHPVVLHGGDLPETLCV
mmetsp:Transcript_9390/g.20559  ORF Transcript_9390/g.20559 Transcript_9390/m.20559 type:complete len:268 (-) Transcript_9390:494-1297(-)